MGRLPIVVGTSSGFTGSDNPIAASWHLREEICASVL